MEYLHNLLNYIKYYQRITSETLKQYLRSLVTNVPDNHVMCLKMLQIYSAQIITHKLR